MVYEKLTEKKILEMCEWLRIYDETGYFPFQKKRIDITLSVDIIQKLAKQKNRSDFIEQAIRQVLADK